MSALDTAHLSRQLERNRDAQDRTNQLLREIAEEIRDGNRLLQRILDTAESTERNLRRS